MKIHCSSLFRWYCRSQTHQVFHLSSGKGCSTAKPPIEKWRFYLAQRCVSNQPIPLVGIVVWLVVLTIVKNINGKDYPIYEMENRKCSNHQPVVEY